MSGMGVRGSLLSRVYCTLDRMKEKISGTIIQQVLSTQLGTGGQLKERRRKKRSQYSIYRKLRRFNSGGLESATGRGPSMRRWGLDMKERGDDDDLKY